MGSRIGQNDVQEKLWTPANIVTVVRICLVPVFVIAILAPWPEWVTIWPSAGIWKPWIAAAIFTLLAATDGVDGYLARSRNEVTNFGKFVDPLADKILVTAALLVLIELGVLPSWIALIILAREFIVSGIRMLAADKGVVIAASWYGKAKTVMQIVAIIMFIIKDSVVISDAASILVYPLFVLSWFVMAAAVVLTIVSMLDYFVKAKDLLGFGSGSSANAKAEADGSAFAAETESVVSNPDGCGEGAVRDCSEIARSVVELSVGRGLTVATAESLTGGLVSAAITSISGSSAVIKGGIVSYAESAKHDLLLVQDETLQTLGAVSGETAVQMAEGARNALGADIAVSTTGIAGPTGEEPGKPLGTVWVAIASDDYSSAHVRYFSGNREEVRNRAVCDALETLEDYLKSRI